MVDTVMIRLTDDELALAQLVGDAQQANNRAAQRQNQYGLQGGREREIHVSVVGVTGEIAFAKWYGRFWLPRVLRPNHGGDVYGFEIRTRDRPDGKLLLHHRDHDDRPYVLALLPGPQDEVLLAGWIDGAEGKRPEFWGDPYKTGRPCFWVPRQALRPMSDIERPTIR